ncbi:MAG: hypothetical protein M0C28_13120 [Candidatus Moduliflexus flocculans]|nr:hypothetical protein [Candidatus Moduliflexus flocculans]
MPAPCALPLAAIAVLLGPQMMRNDLRQDLARLALLKTWPVRGAALDPRGSARAGRGRDRRRMAAPAGRGDARRRAAPGQPGGAVVWRTRASLFTAAFLLAPALIASQLVVQNGLAVLFPAWVRDRRDARERHRRHGSAHAAARGNAPRAGRVARPGDRRRPGRSRSRAYRLTGAILVVLPALIVSAVVLAECWLAIEGLGRVLDRTDPSAVEAAE